MRPFYSFKFYIILLICALSLFSCKTQKQGLNDMHTVVLDTMQITSPRDNPYRAAATRDFDLLHTKLEVKFDWQHQWMYGTEYLTARPHFYPQDSMVLDAKYMDIYKVELLKPDGSRTPLKFTYDTLKLHIQLDREYRADDSKAYESGTDVQQISADNFNRLKNTLSGIRYESNKMDTLQVLADNTHFSTSQVGEMMGLFAIESNKFTIAKMLYKQTTDKEIYRNLASGFSFESRKKEFLQFLAYSASPVDEPYIKTGNTGGLTIVIEYKAKPEDHNSEGSAAIQDNKGLYFINPLGKDTDKPKELWTQGETESSSNWFPTFDKPNFKCTDEIYITVDNKYTTLSNGLLISQHDNGNGTRTDYWRMDLPHSTYLFMMAVGEFTVTKDKWRDREVNYYTEPKFAPYSRQIFGQTPEMIEFFSAKLGVDYVWPKYSQVVARDYVSGAMENTSATLHGEFLNLSPRKMLDEDYHDVIAHELFHHWFGDLVTCESWSNITLNESFADYGEYLWNDYKYGREYADWKNRLAFDKYMGESKRGKNVDLVRYRYEDKEEVFDTHTYEKGGRILHMLRNAVGDDAFFKSLQLYLTRYKFQNAEVSQLRKAFEDVTGRDMNWFFNQWYFNNGHPVLDFTYTYSQEKDSVYIKATQKHNTDTWLTYELPFKIAIHYGKNVETHDVVLNKISQTFAYKAHGKPDLTDADADRILLCERTEKKTTEEYVFQYRNAANYEQRREAIDSLKRRQKLNPNAALVYRDALHDRSESIRAIAARNILIDSMNSATLLPLLKTVLESDASPRVRSAVLDAFGRKVALEYLSEVEKYLGDSSYIVAARALTVLNQLNTKEALHQAKFFENEKELDMKNAVLGVYAMSGDSTYNNYFIRQLHEQKGYSRIYALYNYANFLCRMNPAIAESGIDTIAHLLRLWKDESKQMHTFSIGALDRIKDYYEREKTNNEGILNSDKSTKAKYDLDRVTALLAQSKQIVAHVKKVIEELKK